MRRLVGRRGQIVVLACATAAALATSAWPAHGPLSFVPARVEAAAGEHTPVAIAAGGNHTCAVTAAGTVKCWGLNNFGQLGDGTTIDRNIPVTVAGVSGATAVALGIEHSCALVTGGAVKCWGDNLSGQLGNGTTAGSLVALDVCAVNATPLCSGGSTLTGVLELRAAARHTCVGVASSGLRCWGDNTHGQLGDGTFTDRSTPVVVCAGGGGMGCSAFAGAAPRPGGFGSEGFTCALQSGVPWCWGMNTVGQLGDGTFGADRPLPALVCKTGSAGSCVALSAVSEISAGSAHACARLGSAVKCWGFNSVGQLGDGTFTDRKNPVSACDLLSASGCGAALGDVAGLSLGEHHSCATLVTYSAIACWGEDFFGQLGDGVAGADRAVPGYVCDPAVFCGSPLAYVVSAAGGHGHECARINDGTVECWGYGGLGSLGNAGSADSAEPVTVFGFGRSDIDGDALPDAWELTGDLDDDGTMEVDLPAMGADPFTKDVFVEVDWMDCAVPLSDCAGHNEAPDPLALRAIIAQFWCAPERIVMHIDAGSGSIMHPTSVNCRTRAVDGTTWGTLATGGPIVHNSTAQRIFAPDTRGPNRLHVFHLARLQHQLEDLGALGPPGGYGEQPGDEFWLGLGHNTYPRPVTNTELWQAQTATFIHELGHNLGLGHGGNEDHVTYKPNYLSEMNYIFPTGVITNGAINENWDYSHAVLNPLQEGSLSEQAGLEPDGPLTIVDGFGTRVLGTAWICQNGAGIVFPLFSVGVAFDASHDLDFDCSGAELGKPVGSCVDGVDTDGDLLDDQHDPDCTFAASVSSNIGGGDLVGAGPPGQTLYGHDDWSSLRFDGALIGDPLVLASFPNEQPAMHADSVLELPLPDTDGDTLLDGAELMYGTSALDPDSDDDGLEDGFEVASVLTDPLDPDSDDDGCKDGKEVGPNHLLGGQREPLGPWDFYDVPLPAGPATGADGKLILTGASVRNKAVTLSDVSVILAYVGRTSSNPAYTQDNNNDGVADGQQLDRTPSMVVGQLWRSGPPSGAITLQDVSVALAQVGANCN